jgi:hypothetical protein
VTDGSFPIGSLHGGEHEFRKSMTSSQTRGHYRRRENISLEGLPSAFLHACKIPDIRMAGLALPHEYSFAGDEQEADSNSAVDAVLPAQGTLSAAAACQSPQVKSHKDGS